MSTTTTIINKEIEHFEKFSDQWWVEGGEYAILHQMNPARLRFIKENAEQKFKNLEGKNILDIGCGGGILCEPMARLGGHVTGIDADINAIKTACDHSTSNDTAGKINYINTSVEDLAQNPEHQGKFDIITAMEIIEHIDNLDLFVSSCMKLLAENGIVIFSTINRTPISYALGIIAAEHILRIVPKNTHSWNKFIKPSELSKTARQNGLKIQDIKGMILNPITKEFSLKPHRLEMNYIASFIL